VSSKRGRLKEWMKRNCKKHTSAYDLIDHYLKLRPNLSEEEKNDVYTIAVDVFSEVHEIDNFVEIETELLNEEIDMTTEMTTFESVKTLVDEMTVEQILDISSYCKEKIESMKNEEMSKLEAQMAEIKAKMDAIKGKDTSQKKTGDGAKRTANPIVNPANPEEVYRFGIQPQWLKDLMASTGKTVKELRG
jgi:hypothetical protein